MIPFDLRQTLDAVIAEATVEAEGKGVAVRCHVDGDVPERLRGDAHRLRRSLALLLGHAVEVTDEGTVQLSVRRQAEGAHRGRLRFEVRDGDRRRPLALDGGLLAAEAEESSGLLVWFRLTRLMTGDLGLHCSREQGTSCWFTVDFEPAREAEGAGRGVRQRVLVVDDNLVNQRVACHMLRKFGYEADVCSDGEQALAAVGAGEYGLVLMDCQMPVMDGYRATEVIRSREHGNRRLPIVALTACADGRTRSECLRRGMDGFLTKPLRADDLRRVLAERLSAVREAGDDPAACHPG